VLGVSTVPPFGIYSASKFAVEGLFDTLSQEVAAFGVNVTLIEPGGYATDFNNSSSAKRKFQDAEGLPPATALKTR
jgi:NAD(P)-dependent dehydrogenase (short-subunit alcohol dehydrogenase family)